jgi:hypothetical protein
VCALQAKVLEGHARIRADAASLWPHLHSSACAQHPIAMPQDPTTAVNHQPLLLGHKSRSQPYRVAKEHETQAHLRDSSAHHQDYILPQPQHQNVKLVDAAAGVLLQPCRREHHWGKDPGSTHQEIATVVQGCRHQDGQPGFKVIQSLAISAFQRAGERLKHALLLQGDFKELHHQEQAVWPGQGIR